MEQLQQWIFGCLAELPLMPGKTVTVKAYQSHVLVTVRRRNGENWSVRANQVNHVFDSLCTTRASVKGHIIWMVGEV